MASPSFRPSVCSMPSMRSRAEDAHQVVFERQEEARAAGIALAARAAAQLVVDAAALVALGADHVEAAGFERPGASSSATSAAISVRFLAICSGGALPFSCSSSPSSLEQHVEVAAELNVGATARHVGGDGHRAWHAGLGDDMRLLLVIAGVQHLVRDLVLLAGARRGSPISRSRRCRPPCRQAPIACERRMSRSSALNPSAELPTTPAPHAVGLKCLIVWEERTSTHERLVFCIK